MQLRRSYLPVCDPICLFAYDGLIVERGSHADLLDLRGVYSFMWQQQQESLNTRGEEPGGLEGEEPGRLEGEEPGGLEGEEPGELEGEEAKL